MNQKCVILTLHVDMYVQCIFEFKIKKESHLKFYRTAGCFEWCEPGGKYLAIHHAFSTNFQRAFLLQIDVVTDL